MGYEPIGYILEYEISAIVFLLVIMARFFAARRFPNQKNRLFSLILWVVLVDMILDIVSSVIIDNVFAVPLPVTFTVNITFYSLQIILPMLMTLYTLAMVGYLSAERIRKLVALFLPGIVTLVTLAFTPINHLFFYVDPVKGYVRGSMFIFNYALCVFYMIATFAAAFHYRQRLRKEESMTVYRFLVIVLVSMLIQYFYPALLISGVAIALAVILMYFTIQNPDSMVDSTTGAFTYEAMLAFLRDGMNERSQTQIIAIKILNMSRVNELVGIENGSRILRQISDFLKAGASGTWVFRMRGSCFVAITRNNGDYIDLTSRLCRRAEQPWTVGQTSALLQATVCRVTSQELNGAPISPEDAVIYLETAFSQREHSTGRIRSIAVGAEFLGEVKRRRAVEAALRKALEDGEGLELYYQPIWSADRRRFTSAEVLLRFKHPEMGFIPPDEFVPIAETGGLVTAMDEFVVRKACEFLRDNDHCRRWGLERLEINLSALEFMHRRFPELLEGIITQLGVEAQFLCLEITETAATESFDLLKDCMREIRRFGCGFALDDFGTGYANISQVIQLPFSMVKLDKSLLYGPREVLEDMARMFRRMNRATVVEGAETADQVNMLNSFNVDYIQGYYYARPMPQSDFLRFMKERSVGTEG